MAIQDDAANKQKAIQNRQDQLDASMQKGDQGSGGSAAAQTGIQQPSGDFPAQHLAKPGIEAQMELKPKFMAEGYKGSGKLAGQVAIVTGGDSGIGRAVAILFAAPSRASDGTVQQYMVLPGGPAGLAALQQQGLIIESGASLLITRELFGDAITAAWYAASPGTTGPGAIAILQSFNDAPPPRTGG